MPYSTNGGLEGLEPLAPVARQMIVACKADLTSRGNLYTEHLLHQYRGHISIERLKHAFQTLIDRHDALRRTFLEIAGGELVTQVYPAGTVEAQLEVLNLQNYEATNATVAAALMGITQRPFNLAKAPLVRLAVVHVKGDRHLLLFCYNHCVMDGSSQFVWLRELAAVYNGQELPPLLHHYSEFAIAHRELLLAEGSGSSLVVRQLDYWKEKLRGAPELLELPTEHLRPTMCSFQGRTISFMVPADIYSAIKSFMAQEKQSLLRVMLTAYALTLMMYSQQKDLVISIPRSLRKHDMEGVLGHFINLLPIRLKIGEELAFVDAVKSVGHTIKEAVANGDVTFESIVGACCIGRNASYTPISQASITVHEKGKA